MMACVALGTLVAGGSVRAQDDPEPAVAADGSGGMVLSWHGAAGRSFFLLQSGDLAEWTFCPESFLGTGEVITHEFAALPARLFVRLMFTDVPVTGTPADTDFDGDGLTSGQELAADPRTNPLVLDSDGDGFSDGGLVDDDGDGIPSAWERAHGYDPLTPDPPAVVQLYLSDLVSAAANLEVFTLLR